MPITRSPVGDVDRYPWVKPSDFIKYMDESNNLDKIFGTCDFEVIQPALHVFWARYHEICPNHDVFKRAAAEKLVLERTLPIYIHADEGRTLKKKAIFLLQWQVAFGKGVGRRNSEETMKLQPNFKGHSYSTRFLSALMLRSMYSADWNALETLLELVITDLASLGKDGIQLSQGHLWLAPLGNKGDWSYLMDSANLTRSYRNAPKRESSKAADHGMCHLCYAGMEGYPYEDAHLSFIVCLHAF